MKSQLTLIVNYFDKTHEIRTLIEYFYSLDDALKRVQVLREQGFIAGDSYFGIYNGNEEISGYKNCA